MDIIKTAAQIEQPDTGHLVSADPFDSVTQVAEVKGLCILISDSFRLSRTLPGKKIVCGADT